MFNKTNLFLKFLKKSKHTYFSYITLDTLTLLSIVLTKIYQTKEENIKYICMVLACIHPKIASRLLNSFSEKIKAMIINQWINEPHYTPSEIESFDQLLLRLLTEQFGGINIASKILKHLSSEQKNKFLTAYSLKYPGEIPIK